MPLQQGPDEPHRRGSLGHVLAGIGMRSPSLLVSACWLPAVPGPALAQPAHCEASDWVFVLRKDVQEAINDVYSGSAERLFRFYASTTEDINVSVSYTDKSGATKTVILQAGLPVYLEASRFQLGLSRLGQQGPEVTVRGNFGPCW
jgi:hypothetical protein